ncbi:ABC transporter permease [Microbulbifer halophilus]|uniref:ABC transporter permease n=1 Tax=Microbulbifer halophilus TaxID=453963 RepID=A0ABW5E9S2_9GAMM|nr:FtsX-like permease family protein [Microbulbifer halophilus]MCW8125039.1 FtsX-like permease family protein [Microbulbifer halophilus]
MLELRPILSALWRHKISALLIAVQLGLTLAIVGNASVVIQERMERIARPTGVAVTDIVTAKFMPVAKDYDRLRAFRRDLDMIRQLPGVAAATVSRVPLTGGGSRTGLHTKPNREVGATSSAQFWGDEQLVDALDMKLVAGRDFTASDITETSFSSGWRPSKAIVTQQLAGELFAGGEALGKAVYLGDEDNPIEIVGIVERNLGPWPNAPDAGNAVFYPAIMDTQWFDYVVRAEPGQRDAVAKLLEEKLAEHDPQRVVTVKTLQEQLDRYYAGDNTMIKVLSSVAGLLTFIVALGIVGLTVFWITQRQKQIGVRRALGATRSAISRYFLLENLLIAVTGILIGVAAAQIFNYFLASEFDQPALPLSTTLSCALILLGVSLTATLVPALRAANISPATATRSV